MIFLAQPRTASRSIADALKKIGFVLHSGHHLSLGDISSDITDPIHADNDWFIMSAVRNHYDILPCWLDHRDHYYKLPFGVEFLQALLEEPFFDPDGKRLYWKYRDESTHLIRFEDLQANLNKILALRELGPVELPHIGKKEGRKHYSTYHTPETRTFIEDMFCEEMQELGYGYETS